jgi:hypothetical protein
VFPIKPLGELIFNAGLLRSFLKSTTLKKPEKQDMKKPEKQGSEWVAGRPTQQHTVSAA